MANKGKTYEIFCKRGLNRDNCKFRKRDKELHCSICEFAGFLERTADNWRKEPYQQEAKTNIKEDEQQ